MIGVPETDKSNAYSKTRVKQPQLLTKQRS